MEDDFIVVDTHISKTGKEINKTKECLGSMLLSHYTGLNTDCFVITKYNDKRVKFSLSQINGIYYLIINGDNMADYKKFTNIEFIKQQGEDVVLKNPFLGTILVKDCDVDMVQEGLKIVEKFFNKKRWWIADIIYYLFH